MTPAVSRPGVSSRSFWRLGLGVADAAVPSVGNLGVSVLAAHVMTLPDFGVFSTVLLSLILLVGVSRSLHGDVLVLTAAADAEGQADRIRQSLASVLLLGLVVGLLTALAGGATLVWASDQSPWGPALVVAGVVLPILLLQDHHRWIAYTQGHIRDSVLNNMAWVTGSITAMVVLVILADTDIPAFAGVLIWGLAAAGGWGISTLQNRYLPSLRRGTAWLRENRRMASGLAQDFGLLQASAQGALILLAILTSAADIGLLRKAQLWLGPVTMLTTGLLSALQSILARRHDSARPGASTRVTLSIGSSAAAGTLLYGAIVLLLPTSIAALLAGGDWVAARPFVWPLTVQLAMGLLGGCIGIALRVRGQIAQQVRARWVLAPASLAIVTLAATTSGALAATWGLAAVSVLTTCLWYRLLVQRIPAVAPAVDAASAREVR